MADLSAIGTWLGPAVVVVLTILWFVSREVVLRRRLRETIHELRQSEDRFRSVTQTAVDPIVATDGSGRIIFANAAAARTFGPEVTAEGATLERFVHDRGPDRPLEGIRPDGARIPMEASFSRWESDEGERYTAILRDITERDRQARRTAAEHAATRVIAQYLDTTQTLDRIVEAICAALAWPFGAAWLVDPHTGTLEPRATWCAKGRPELAAFEELTRASRFASGVALPGHVLKTGRQAWITDARSDLDLPRAPAGRRAGLRGAFGVPILEQGKVVGVLEFFSDTSDEPDERVVAMMTSIGMLLGVHLARLRSDQAVRELNRELESYNYTVAHDLRAPLRTISGFSQILLDEHGAELDEDAQQLLDRVIRGASEMAKLIEDLLAFARLGQAALHRSQVDVAALARSAVKRFEADLAGRDIKIEVGEMPTCQADEGLLAEVLANLVGNAIKYTRKEEHAEVEIAWDAKERAYFVRDNGVGFDMADAAKLFGVFQRLHRADEFEGTGAGLAIAHRIISKHGGRIWARSAPGEGACFSFTIPGASTS